MIDLIIESFRQERPWIADLLTAYKKAGIVDIRAAEGGYLVIVLR